jgi:hypothetical protein
VKVEIKTCAKTTLRNNIHEVILQAGECFTIIEILPGGGLYKILRANGREKVIARDWLVECGALQ